MSRSRHTIYAFVRTSRHDANFRKSRFFTGRPWCVSGMFLTTNYRFIAAIKLGLQRDLLLTPADSELLIYSSPGEGGKVGDVGVVDNFE